MFEKIFGQNLEWHLTCWKYCGIMSIVRWHFYYRWRVLAERRRRAKLKPMVARIGREIQRGHDIWTTRDGRTMYVTDMTNEHLKNAIAYLEKRRLEIMQYKSILEAEAWRRELMK